MGGYGMPPTADDSPSDKDDDSSQLGDQLSGRFSEVNIDSVEAVRDERERD